MTNSTFTAVLRMCWLMLLPVASPLIYQLPPFYASPLIAGWPLT